MKTIIMKTKMLNTGYTFEETYEVENNVNAREYAEEMITNFNNTLRPNESPRELVDVKEN
ncbi:MAG TPA: hypothetical protein DC000_05090 [Clostridiales bacterium]|nr:hypothetical protein [Clostridiales bacterium]